MVRKKASDMRHVVKNAPQLAGNSGFEKLTRLFRKANAVYDKGYAISKFISSLNLDIIREKRKAALKELEEALSVILGKQWQ